MADIDSAGHAALSLQIAARNCTSNQQLAGSIRLTTEGMDRDELAAVIDCLVVLLRRAESQDGAV
nr:hypothetical protein CPGR_05712 [Mycolicibacter nonchromogenicus]